jgi:hypothetical protein
MDYFSIFKIIIDIFFILEGVILFFVLCSIFYLAKTRVAYVKTPAGNIDRILAEINLPKDSLIYDLGCGDGTVLFAAEKSGYQAIGYELSFYPYLKCLLRKIVKHSSIKIYRKNFFQEDLSKANAIFVFLVDKVMAKTGEKLLSELKPRTMVVSYGFAIPRWEVVKTINTSPSKTYIYQI